VHEDTAGTFKPFAIVSVCMGYIHPIGLLQIIDLVWSCAQAVAANLKGWNIVLIGKYAHHYIAVKVRSNLFKRTDVATHS
jgi:hypothetical protein